ncbi:uncharacterized protein Triagg1_6290 [Trichoderma aggressivum f. europaeum]|uniref:Nucleoside phosphorylase domain-containing protein n=1 Tax=Trichoderma aggressivum f. europaeum TaxID=173218 RepID=A0AAE1LXU7_9HYPO|nr:hypothetical protein Triagg1_6290 [Trichoderma aggressivum f. europaeum]
MVGIGGGVSPKVRLGDVVISTPDGQHPGVVQWDMGKAEKEGFKRTGALNNPPNSLLSDLNKVETEHKLLGSKIPEYLAQAAQNYPRAATRYLKSDSLKDMLFQCQKRRPTSAALAGSVAPLCLFLPRTPDIQADCVHVNELKDDKEQELDGDDSEEKERDGCRLCDKTAIVKRKPRSMRVHYGLIASGNQVIKDAVFRDKLNQALDGEVLCFEMEAAGLMNNFPCLVIRGICDYSDSHKNKAWQEHAAAVAAAFAKELLNHVQLSDVKGERPAVAILNKELQEALAVQVATSALDKDNIPTIDHLTQACAPLVVVDSESKIIRLAHHTLQEYFERQDNTLLSKAHVTITNICMTYLSFSAFQSGPLEPQDPHDLLGNEGPENHLHSYAARYWGYHTHKALAQGLDPSKVVSFLERVPQDSCVVDLLITKGYDPNAEDSMARTPLWWAARNGHAPVVKRLLELDVELESKDDVDYQTALSAAARQGHELVVQLLLDKGADLESQGGVDLTPIYSVLKKGGRKIQHLGRHEWTRDNHKILIKKGANIETKDHEGFTPLMWAVKNGHKGTIELLTANDACIMAKDNDGLTVFGHADEAILESLFAKAANLKVEDDHGWTALAWAAVTQNTMLAKFLLTRDVNIEARDHKGMTPFTLGVISGNTIIPKLLLTHNASLETKDDCDRTPLICAARVGDGPMIKFLLSKNVDIEAKCHEGLTPLGYTIFSDHYEAGKILVDNGANVNHQIIRGLTILHLAATKASRKIASLLLESATIDVDPMDDTGRSPLSHAAENGNYDVAKALLTTGKVDIESTDEFSRTPMWYAKNEAKDERLVQLLLSYGAKELDDSYFTNGSSEEHESVKRRLSNESSDSPPFKRRC